MQAHPAKTLAMTCVALLVTGFAVGQAATPPMTDTAAGIASRPSLEDLTPGEPFIVHAFLETGAETLLLTGLVPHRGGWAEHEIRVPRDLADLLTSLRLVLRTAVLTIPLRNPWDDSALRLGPTADIIFPYGEDETAIETRDHIADPTLPEPTVAEDVDPGWWACPLVLSAAIPATVAPGNTLTLVGCFPPNPATSVCVMLPGGQVAAPLVGTSSVIQAEVIGGSSVDENAPVCIVTGSATFVDGSTAPSVPQLENPDWRLWSGQAGPFTTAQSIQSITVLGTQGITPFTQVGGETVGQVWALAFPPVDVGDLLCMFLRVHENGMSHDFFLVDPENNAQTKYIFVEDDMTGTEIAEYFGDLLSAAMGGAIPGLQITTIDNVLTLSVRIGTGIEGLEGAIRVT